ncbi:MAG: ATP-binding cassette domain-containing protein [Desulfobacterales bacterium]|nr:ATP-binding cassette domain-containing protein [Desulfobacterales bacterium]MDP6808162.1 ATP-binding cassette domain-containing protein [Desulfobacterales bacterium]
MATPDQLKTNTPPLLRVTGLKRYFDVSEPFLNRLLEGKSRLILKAVIGIDFKINRGQTFALVGESGCGKSTVANLVVGLYQPTAGKIEFDGIDVASLTSRAQMALLRRRMAMIFQDPYASLNPRWRVDAIVSEPIRAFGLLKGTQAIFQRTGELLAQVGLSPADGEKYPHEFSGGQRQRISIARALASEPDFIVCDEPTSALDVSVQAQILNLMKGLQKKFDLSYLFISHDLAVVRHMADRVGVMYLGQLCEVAPVDAIFDSPLHPYTRLLLDTIPDPELTGRSSQPVTGEIPNPIDPPSGCAFHPRCPESTDKCRREGPELTTLDSGVQVACHAISASSEK